MNLQEILTRFPEVQLTDKEHTVTLGENYKHFLRQPEAKTILLRDTEIKHEIMLNKSRKPIEDDGIEADELDAKYYDLHKIKEPEGYSRPAPLKHKANAFRGMYSRFFEVAEGADMLGDVIPVLEIIGTKSNPQKVIVHNLRQPADKDQRRMLRLINRREEEPDKNGKTKVIFPSYLIPAMTFYTEHLDSLPNSYIEKQDSAERVLYKQEIKNEFISHVDPLIQRMIVKTFVEAIEAASQD